MSVGLMEFSARVMAFGGFRNCAILCRKLQYVFAGKSIVGCARSPSDEPAFRIQSFKQKDYLFYLKRVDRR